MNFDMNNNNQNNIQNNNRLLRFRSAPSYVLQSYVNDIEKTRDVTHEMNYNFVAQSLQDLEPEVELKPNLMSSQLSVNYPRQSTTTNQFGVENLEVKSGSNLFRQNSSPAGLFANINPPNGEYLIVVVVLLMILLFSCLFV